MCFSISFHYIKNNQDQPRVAQNICWAFTSLSDAAYDHAAGMMTGGDSETPPTYCMSKYYSGTFSNQNVMTPIRQFSVPTITLEFVLLKMPKAIIEKLLETTNRADGNQNNLRGAAYEAVMEMIKNAPQDCYGTVLNTTTEIMNRIQNLFQLEATSGIPASQKSQFHDLQSLLCATLQAVVRKVRPEDIAKIADQCMEALLKMMR